jgi:hypothetical protein
MLLSALLWSTLLVSLFAAPDLMAVRGTAGDSAGHTAELIRRHQEAASALSLSPEMEGPQAASPACEQPEHEPVPDKEETSVRDGEPDDESMIRPVGGTPKRIRT